jgi:acyl-CoA thioester hydrolase
MLTHKTTCRVIYGDTDNMGVAYHANYLRWFEMGRTEMFRSLGLPYKTIESKGVFLPVSEVHCKFMTPVHYDDVIGIEISLDTSIKGGMKFDYNIVSADGTTIHARGYTKHAFVNQDGRVTRPPKFLLEVIQNHIPRP